MIKHIRAIALALGLAFFAAGVGGMVIEVIFGPQQPFWVFFWMTVFGLVVSLISLFHSQMYGFYKYLKAKTLTVWNVTTHIKESSEFLKLKNEQEKKPENWLYSVIEYIDLNRQGISHHDNDVYVKFQIDSHLLFPVNVYVFARLHLTSSATQFCVSEWYGILKEPPGYAYIWELRRYGFASQRIRLIGRTDSEKVLLQWMQDFRKGKQLLAMLTIGVKVGDHIGYPTPLDGSHWIAPKNDYRGE